MMLATPLPALPIRVSFNDTDLIMPAMVTGATAVVGNE